MTTSLYNTQLSSCARCQTTQAIEPHAEGGWVSQSNLTATIPMNMREDMVVSCYALNPSLGINEVGTIKVTVQCE